MSDLRHITIFSSLHHPRGWVALAALFLAFQLWGCGSGNSSPQQANFSDYYPMTKGFYRTYKVTTPDFDPLGQPITVTEDTTEALTVGATYNGVTSVRTCKSSTVWSDDVTSAGSILREAGAVPGLPVFGTMTLGIDGWKVNQSLISSLTTFLRINSAPILTPATVTFRGLEDVKVPAGIFKDTMKIDFSSILDAPPPDNIHFSIIRTHWFARGVGLVKSLGSGRADLFLTDYDKLELTDYGTLPSPPPQLLTVSPTGSPVDQATEVTLTGDDFSSVAQVTFGPWPAASVTVESPTVIKAVTPTQSRPGVPGSVPPVGTFDVTVTNVDRQVSLMEDAFTFE